MSRIFSGLACVSVVSLASVLLLGFNMQGYNDISSELRLRQVELQRASGRMGVDRSEVRRYERRVDAVMSRLQRVQRDARIHMLLGIFASLVTVLVQSIGVTYFIGTGRWCREVTEGYGLEGRFVSQMARLKRRSFPYALLGTATVLAIGALGAAADPGTLRENTAQWVAPHYWAGILGTVFICAALWWQRQLIKRNQVVIERVLEEVRRIRCQQGLECPSARPAEKGVSTGVEHEPGRHGVS